MSWNMYGAQRIAETDIADKFAAEETVAQFAANLTGLDLVSFPRYSVVDRLLTLNGLPSSFLEIKTRTTARGTFPTYRVSTSKLTDLRALASLTDVTVNLIVAWGCGSIGLANVMHPEWVVNGDHAELNLDRFLPLRRPA